MCRVSHETPAWEHRTGDPGREKGSLLTIKTTMASASRRQPDKGVPVEPGYLPSREKAKIGLGLSEFSREDVLTVSLGC